jgi:hypothetical protein
MEKRIWKGSMHCMGGYSSQPATGMKFLKWNQSLLLKISNFGGIRKVVRLDFLTVYVRKWLAMTVAPRILPAIQKVS